MKRLLAISLILPSLLITFASSASMPVEVSWSNVEKYRDLRAANEAKSKFQQRFFKEMSNHLNKLAEQLPHGYKLTMDVDNVDLAGRITFVNGQEIRVIKDMFYPNMSFSYTLTDDKGQVLDKRETKAKGKAFMMNTNSQLGHRSFPYEKNLLSHWFNKELLANLKESDIEK
ncbi:MAG: hypothetical protein CL811_00960 [Colwelliaceae bacterium]|nr:hypothetical protein [Colwelliaceae bacterium]